MADKDTFDLTDDEKAMLERNRANAAGSGTSDKGSADEGDNDDNDFRPKPKDGDDKDPGSTFGDDDADDKGDEGDKGGDGDDDKGGDKSGLELKEGDDTNDTGLPDHGIDFAALTNEIAKDGTLSEDSMADLVTKASKIGFDADMVAVYMVGLQTMQNSSVSAAHEIAGGKEEYGRMATWANQNLSAEDRAAFNESLKAGPAQAKLAVAGVNALYQKASGRGAAHDYSGGGNSPGGGDGGTSGNGAISSRTQFREIQRSDRYKADASYRTRVHKALAKAQQSGTYRQE